MTHKRTFLALYLLLWGFFLPLEAWNETGHMLIAEIAKQHLNSATLKEVEKLNALFQKDYPESSSPITCACWADDLREHGCNAFNKWHYTLNIFDPENVLSAKAKIKLRAENADNNVEWAIRQAMDTLKSRKSRPFERAMMLRFLYHFVGDIHQPLHCATRFSKKHPEGDAGGNLFKLPGLHESNLHKFWDSGLGLFKKFRRPLNPTNQKKIERQAAQIIEMFPPETFQEKINASLPIWGEESYQWAVSFAYNLEEGCQPDPDYIQSGQQIVMQRTALAGYRLAYLLNSWLK